MSALVHVSLLTVGQSRAQTGMGLAVPNSVEVAASTATSSSTSQTAKDAGGNDLAATALGSVGQFWRVVAYGGAVHVAFGTSPTAVTDVGHMCPDGVPMEFAVTTVGEKCAIKDAA